MSDRAGFQVQYRSIINMVLHKNEFWDEFWKIRLPMKSGVLPWEKVYLFSKRSNRAAWYGGMYTKEKISNHDLIWSNENDLWGTKKGKMWFASMGKKRPWPTWKCWLLMKKGNPKEKKRYSCLFLRRYFVEHSYHDNGVLNHILDDGKLVNHSHTPNAGAGVYDYDLGLLQQPNLYAQPWSLYRLRTSFDLCSQRY